MNEQNAGYLMLKWWRLRKGKGRSSQEQGRGAEWMDVRIKELDGTLSNQKNKTSNLPSRLLLNVTNFPMISKPASHNLPPPAISRPS